MLRELHKEEEKRYIRPSKNLSHPQFLDHVAKTFCGMSIASDVPPVVHDCSNNEDDEVALDVSCRCLCAQSKVRTYSSFD